MPAVPLFIMDPLWSQIEALIPPMIDNHPLGCHRPRVADRVIFDKLIQVLVLGAAYEKSATPAARRLRFGAAAMNGLKQASFLHWNKSAWKPTTASWGWTWRICVWMDVSSKPPVVAKSRGNPQSTAANRAPNVPWLPMATASHWAAWVHQPTATTHHC